MEFSKFINFILSECVGIDGRNRRTFVSNVKYPFGLALGGDTFYWSDWNT